MALLLLFLFSWFCCCRWSESVLLVFGIGNMLPLVTYLLCCGLLFKCNWWWVLVCMIVSVFLLWRLVKDYLVW